MGLFARFTDGLNRIGVTVSELALVALLGLTVYAVIARYVFSSPSIYGLEVSVYLLLVIAWGSAGWVLKVDRHVSMEALYAVSPRWAQQAAGLLSRLSVLAFCLVLAWAGSVNVISAFEHGYRSSSLLRFPMWIPYALIPIGATMIALMAMRKLSQGRDF